ncbi:MAG: hypothetical protein ACRDQ7_22775 [Haloechinothrix sp.]
MVTSVVAFWFSSSPYSAGSPPPDCGAGCGALAGTEPGPTGPASTFGSGSPASLPA